MLCKKLIKCFVSEIQKVAHKWSPKKTLPTAVYEVTHNLLQFFSFKVNTHETCCIVFQPKVPQPTKVSGSNDTLKYDLTHLNRAVVSIYD